NSKGNLYLTINTFMLGGIIAGFTSLHSRSTFSEGEIFLFLVPALLANMLSFVCTLRAITPFVKNSARPVNESMLFFCDVSRMPDNKWATKWSGLNIHEWNNDLREQAKLLAKGLDRKYRRLQTATLYVIAEIGIVILFAIYFFIL